MSRKLQLVDTMVTFIKDIIEGHESRIFKIFDKEDLKDVSVKH